MANFYALVFNFFFAQQLREQKRKEAILLKEWSRPREDLELDDLKVTIKMITNIQHSLYNKLS